VPHFWGQSRGRPQKKNIKKVKNLYFFGIFAVHGVARHESQFNRKVFLEIVVWLPLGFGL
jgi:hypothetical protein